MSYRTFLRYYHKCDVYSRTVSVNSAGQRAATFSVSKSSTPCVFQTISSERRVAPYVDNVDEFQLIVPHSYASYFTYQGRVQNIVDRYGNVIEAGPFEVVQIEKKTGFNGKVSHILVTIRLVVENA
jgi:hypothetical protein